MTAAASDPIVHPSDWRLFAAPVILIALLLGIAGLAVLSLAIGITAIPFGDIPAILFSGAGERVHRIVLWDLRLPRVLVGLMAGAAMAISGAMLQDALRNDLAEPGLLGVASGASLVVAVAVILGIALPFGALPVAALVGGLIAGGVILLITRLTRDPVRMLLVGAAMAAVFSALITITVVLGDPDQIRALYAYLVGSLIGSGWDDARAIFPWFAVLVPLALLQSRALNLLQLGDDMAAGLGLPVVWARAGIFATAIVLMAPIVAYCGPIGFVALIAPHLARSALGTSNALVVLPISALTGALLLAASDLLAREILSPAELPVGLIVTVLGSPIAILLLRRQITKRNAR